MAANPLPMALWGLIVGAMKSQLRFRRHVRNWHETDMPTLLAHRRAAQLGDVLVGQV
jgi:hypothetical protein